MKKLKPCPFCGGEARVNTLKWVSGYTATALCKNEPNCHYLDTWDEDEEKAIGRIIEAWNTRAERTCRNTQTDFDFMCSECGKCVDNGRVLGFNFCPGCGARIEVER